MRALHAVLLAAATVGYCVLAFVYVGPFLAAWVESEIERREWVAEWERKWAT
jgi:hypothetical protein